MSKVTIHTKTYGPPEIRESLDAQIKPNYPVDKYAAFIRKSGKAVRYLQKGATGKFQKQYFFPER